MKENLQEISIWLKNNAPKILQHSLQSPVNEDDFQNLEKLILVGFYKSKNEQD